MIIIMKNRYGFFLFKQIYNRLIVPAFMIPKDKFGNQLYSNTFNKMLAYGRILSNNGYRENNNKPNLFYKKVDHGWFNADMRGTEIVKMWEDPRPAFFWSFDSEILGWFARRMIKNEVNKLYNEGCECRIHVMYDPSEDRVFSGVKFISTQIPDPVWDDGYCKVCGKDFQDEGSFCSKECEHQYEEALKETCEVCDKKVNYEDEILHHIKYFPPIVVVVHRSCHNKIHKTNEYPHLKPSEEEIKEYYGKRK